MGYGTFDEDNYHNSRATRAAANLPDFEYTNRATKVHESLDPYRIKNKPFLKLESRDNQGRVSTPIIFTFDVTGSNISNAKVAQAKLPELMNKLTPVCDNPQIAIWANDDVKVEGRNAIQLGDFESDNRIDDVIRNLWLTGNGGGNGGESYDLLVYAAARYTVTDSFEKRKKKGYMFIYADEPFFSRVSSKEARLIFEDGCEANIPVGDIIAEAKERWNIFVIWPKGGQLDARQQYEELFGMDNVLISEGPGMLCDLVASTVSMYEERLKNTATVTVGEDYQRFE